MSIRFKLLYVFIASTMLSLQSCKDSSNEALTMELDATWSFSQKGSDVWNAAKIPGNVHLDLERNGIIENPFYGNNEESLQWIEHEDWHYKGEFTIDHSLLKFQNIDLEFLGLDTYADVVLNGQQIISSDNMFVAYTYGAKELLKQGKNTIEIIFHSPIKKAMPLFKQSNFTYPADNDRSEEHLSVFTRKAPYHYGWDWGPRFVTSGVWRPIQIKAWNNAHITNKQFVQKELNSDVANIQFKYEIEASSNSEATIEVELDGKTIASKNFELKLGENNIALDLSIDNPTLWWPNGMGDANLYSFKTILKSNHKIVDTNIQRVGLRTINVVNKPDSIGESFFLEVNGIPTFIKGANYIPNDCFLGQMTDSVYQNNINDALESNMNMLRVWGGGVYEDDTFYDLADENGILIWQDFMFACTMYPSDDDFLANVEKEATYNIKRLRNHASVAMWCGNNEIKVGWDNWGWQDKYQYSEQDQQELLTGYDKLFNQLLPNKVKELDPQRFYYDSSPISNWGNKADMVTADNHYWGVWWGKHEFEKFNEYVPRFMSEFGFQSFPSMQTIKAFSEKEDWDIESEVMGAHQKSSIGNVTIKEYMERDYKMPSSFEDFVYLNQVMQAEGMRIGFEAHRRNKPFNMGTLYWQFNDVWPAVSWSGIDYYGRWKAMQYFIKKAFEPIVSSAIIEDGKLRVHIISDKVVDTEVESALQVIKLDGTVIWEQNKNIVIEANQNQVVLNAPLRQIIGKNNKADIAVILNTSYDSKTVESTFLLTKVKNLKLKKADIQYRIQLNGNNADVYLQSSEFMKNVEISADLNGKWSDNYFDLVPHKEYKVQFKGQQNISQLESIIQFKSIIDTF